MWDNKVKLIEFYKQTSTLPYVSGEMSAFSQDYFCTVDVNRTVSIWNINRT